MLFFDAQLSANGQVSCATCHLPDRQFQDGKPLAQGIGTTARRTMPIAGRRDVVRRAPYKHAGQLVSFAEVVAHYNAAPAARLGTAA